MSDVSRLREAGDRLANVIEHNAPRRMLDRPILQRALEQWDEAVQALVEEDA